MFAFIRNLLRQIPVGTPPMIFVTIIAVFAGIGFISFVFFPWPLTIIFLGMAVAAAALFENGWIDTEGTNPPYLLARLWFGHYVPSDIDIRLEPEVGKRFFFLYGFMSTFKLFDMSQHQTTLVAKDVKTVGPGSRKDRRTGKPIAITQSTGNVVEILYVYHIDPCRASDFIRAAGEIDGEKTEQKHFSAIEKKLGAAIESALNQICGDPSNALVITWEDLASKRDEIAKMVTKALTKRKRQQDGRNLSILETCGIQLVRILISDVKPDKALEERQEQISLAKKQGEVNQAQAKAQAVRTKAYIDGMTELKNAGLSADDAASLYAAMNKDVPASTIFVRGGDKNNVAAAAVLSAHEEKTKPAKGGKP